MSKTKIAVLVSGRGSNLQALIDAANVKNFPAEIVLVLSNKSDAKALDRAKKANIPTAILSHKDFSCREDFDKAMDAVLREAGAEFVFMAGFMRILSSWFTSSWAEKLINIHPSLLPSFKGLDAQQQALDAGVKMAGCSVHFVTEEMDSGPIIAQAAVPVIEGDTADSLEQRILEQEHIIYPYALKIIASGKYKIAGGKVVIEK